MGRNGNRTSCSSCGLTLFWPFKLQKSVNPQEEHDVLLPFLPIDDVPNIFTAIQCRNHFKDAIEYLSKQIGFTVACRKYSGHIPETKLRFTLSGEIFITQ